MDEITLAKDRFDTIMDHFSSVELDSCVESVMVQIFMRRISKSLYNSYLPIYYVRGYVNNVSNHKIGWTSNSFSSGPMSIADSISFIESIKDKYNILTSVVIHAKTYDHDVRYKQYLYDISTSIRNQIGIEFTTSPSIPFFEEDFFVGFSLMDNQSLYKISNDIIENLEKEDAENLKKNREEYKSYTQSIIGTDVTTTMDLVANQLTNPFVDMPVAVQGEISKKKNPIGFLFSWVYKKFFS